jgi:phosphoadenosine phosphosulfate reductase
MTPSPMTPSPSTDADAPGRPPAARAPGHPSAARATSTSLPEPPFDAERAPAAELLRWAAAAVPEGRLVVSTAFGPGGIVLLHLLHEEGLRLPVIFIDTLHHFPETLALAERVRERYDLDLRVERPAEDLATFERMHGRRLWERDIESFHRVTKAEPMDRALAGVEGWITARRRDQSPSRATLPVLEPWGGGTARRLKINPLAGWSHDRVWAFIRTRGLPHNPLHDRGYASIGDEPLTTPVAPGEPERAGRWRGSARTECGLHRL